MPTQELCESILAAAGAKPRKASFLTPAFGVMLQQPASSMMEWLNSTFKAVAFNVQRPMALLNAHRLRDPCMQIKR